MRYVIAVISVLLLCGCTQKVSEGYSQEMYAPAVSINDYFGVNISSFHYKVINQSITCVNGSCPAPQVSVKGVTLQCNFCASNNTGIVGDNFRVLFGRGGWADMSSGCTTAVDTYEVTGLFDIISINSTDLIARVTRGGHVKKSGSSCDETYEYDYVNIEDWYFTN